MHKKIAILIAVAAIPATTVQAQDLFNIRFHAVCKPSDSGGGRTRMNDADLIEQCVGTGLSKRELRRDYALVYDPAADSIQVVIRSNAAPVCDVFLFQGGSAVTNGALLERFTFVFSPNQTNAIGSAIITERAINGDTNSIDRAHISGRIQFTMPATSASNELAAAAASGNGVATLTPSGSVSAGSTAAAGGNANATNAPTVGDLSTNNGPTDGSGPAFVEASAAASTSHVQICRGNFRVGSLLAASAAPAQSISGNTPNVQSVSASTGSRATDGTTNTTSVVSTTTTESATNTSANIMPPSP